MKLVARSGPIGAQYELETTNQGTLEVETEPDGGGGGDISPLSRLYVVDPSGGGGTIDGAFSGLQAFATLAAGIAGAPDGSTLVLMPGDYSAEGARTWAGKSLGFYSFAPNVGDVVLPNLTATGAGGISVWNCQTKNVTAADGFGVKAFDALVDGTLTGSSITLRNCVVTPASVLDGDVSIDLVSFDSLGTGGGTWVGPPASFDIVDATPLHGQLYVDQNAFRYGNGAPSAPFNKLADAIAAAPDLPSVTQIWVAPGDYAAEGGIEYTDKRLTILGWCLFNQSATTTPTHGLLLRPSSSDGSTMVLEVQRVNCNIIAQTLGLLVIAFQAYVEGLSDGTHVADFSVFGTIDTMVLGSNGTLQHDVNGVGVGLGPETLNGTLNLRNSIIGAPVTLVNALVSRSILQECEIRDQIDTAHALELWECTFPADASLVLFPGTGEIVTDLATYARGVQAGVTWPAALRIIDTAVQLQPVRIDSAALVNSLANATPALPANAAGDLFVCWVNAVLGAAPTLPAGWTKQAESTDGTIISQVWTRDTRSAGGEAGTITVTNGGGNSPLQAFIESYRNVATSAFIESISTANAAGATIAGPTVVAGGAGRLAVAGIFGNAGATTPAITGQTGGTWVDGGGGASGLGASATSQTAALADSGTITGGTANVGATRALTIGFALVGSIT